MKAVIYARYSSDNQREESIEGQIRGCTDYAEENGYTFFDISDNFKDETGALDYTYDAGDGLHFNQTFYHAYLELLTTEMPAAAA